MMKRQLISVLLVLAMLIGMLPFAAMAAETDAENEDLQEGECQHTETEVIYVQMEDSLIHTVTEVCTCGEVMDEYDEDCFDEDADEICDGCQRELPAEEPECEHTETFQEYAPQKDSLTHTATHWCDCGEVVDQYEEDCVDEDQDGWCDLCDADVPVEPIPGDVDGDRELTMKDAMLIAQYVAKLLDEIDETLADVDEDGYITAADAVLVLRACVDDEESNR